MIISCEELRLAFASISNVVLYFNLILVLLLSADNLKLANFVTSTFGRINYTLGKLIKILNLTN